MGIDPDSDGSTIRNRYRQLSKLYHPDVVRSTDERNDEMFLKLQEAYRILSSPQKRSIYDWRVYLDALQGGSGRMGRWEEVARAASANSSKSTQKRPPSVQQTKRMDEEEMVSIAGQGYVALAFDLFAVVVSFLAIVLVSLKDRAPSL